MYARRPALEQKLNTGEDKGRLATTVREWIVALVIALVTALVLTQVVFVNAKIPSESMENTIMAGDRVVGYRMAYWFSDPASGDIIIFRFPDDERQLYVKRIIGMPGETVEVIDGAVYINNQPKPELDAHVKGRPTGNFGPYTVPADSYFVMGDNRNLSYDSRYWNQPFVSRKAVLGRAGLRLLPKPGVLK